MLSIKFSIKRGRSVFTSSLLTVVLSIASSAALAIERKVLIIGIDGLRPDALVAANTPAIDALIAQGAVAYNVQAEDISLSGPCWSSILTGVHRNKHLVTSNSFIPADFNTHPHFFARVREACPQLRKASIVHWAPINQRIALGQADLIQTFATDLEVRNAAIAELSLPASLSADITFLHFDDVDHAGHGFGFSPTIPQYISAIQATDAHIAQVIASVQSRPSYANEDWLIVICSDHGGSGTSHGANTPEHRTTLFVFSGPSTQQGVSLTGPMTLADIAPTIMQFLGISVNPAWGWDGNHVGLTLLGRLRSRQFARPSRASRFFPRTLTQSRWAAVSTKRRRATSGLTRHLRAGSLMTVASPRSTTRQWA